MELLEGERNEERERCARMAEEWASHRSGDAHVALMSLSFEIRSQASNKTAIQPATMRRFVNNDGSYYNVILCDGH